MTVLTTRCQSWWGFSLNRLGGILCQDWAEQIKGMGQGPRSRPRQKEGSEEPDSSVVKERVFVPSRC